MAASSTKFQTSRELLSRAILEALKSWPESQRRIFIQAHYRGRSVPDIAGSMKMEPAEVSRVLRLCERSLFQALEDFRKEGSGEPQSSRAFISTSGCGR